MNLISVNSLEIFKKNTYIPSDIGLVSDNTYLSVVATNNCNMNCPYCINSLTDRSLNLSVNKMSKNVKELLKHYDIKEAIILWWEPTLHPDIVNMIKALNGCWIKKVRLTTNGIALTDKLLIDMVNAWLYGINISYHNEDFISKTRLSEIFSLCKKLKIKLRINTNIRKNNHDNIDDFIDFYNNHLKDNCNEVRVSNIILKDSFSVNEYNSFTAKQMILSDDEYNDFFTKLINSFDVTKIDNPDTLGFVRYILIPISTPIIVNRNINSKVSEQVCENAISDISKRKINTFKYLVSGNISLSWNEWNTFIK